ncbi:MAG: glucose-6-phosphate dehydrogenase (coenzyme-F420) [Pseudomonadota bacterium]|jgi:coenzyme F420-dependent glucose-6-phosphate dehydrogenase|nr:glucose-6-phosphate dehydrogenase (coenzyme-F420) [Pseudomonadota bacterium]
MIRIGYKASAEQFGPRQLLRYAILAEELGFDSVLVSDHFQPWRHHDGHAPFALAWLGALGACTSRIMMGTSVLTPTFRYPPAIVAQAFGTLGVLFPKRVVLGVGTGESLNEVPATAMAWPEQRERTLRLKEALALIRRLWREDRVSFEGQYYRTEKATVYDRPEEPVPIYVAGAGPLIAKYAGETAEGFICTSGKAPELYRDTLVPAVAAGRRTAKRGPESVDMIIEMKVSYDPDPARALDDTRCWAALALSPQEKLSVEDPLEMERLAEALPAERAASRWIVSSDPDEHLERIRAYVELGFRHLVFHAPGLDQEGFLRRYAEQILPRLRRAFG